MPIGKANGTTGPVVEKYSDVVGKADIQVGSTLQTAPAPVARALQTVSVEGRKETGGNSVDDAKSRRILRQGVYQAVLQSPGLASLPIIAEAEFLKLVERVAEAIIEKVQK